MLYRLLLTLFPLISLQSNRFVPFPKETTFLLPPVSFVSVLKFCASRGVFFVNIDFILEKNAFFACAILHVISILLRPSFDIKVLKHLNWSLCFSLFTLIRMLICGHSLFRMTFYYDPFLLFSFSTMSNNCCKSSLLFTINTLSPAYCNLLTLCPSTLIPGYPSRFRILISL